MHTDSSFSLPVNAWRPAPDAALCAKAVEQLEQGCVLLLPSLPFTFTPEEAAFLNPACVKGDSKSIKFSLECGTLWGASPQAAASPALGQMLRRYAESARDLVAALFPAYVPALLQGNTSFRPVEAEGRVQSRRHDDRLLHVDAFPSRPTHGARLLRVFTNVHPGSQPRVWRVGESFAEVAARFLPRISPQLPCSAALLHALRITKSRRSAYDHYMMHLHDRMKLDDEYQKHVPHELLNLAPGTTWIVYSDQVSHAAMSGCYLMEQTFTLPPAAQVNPATSPLKVLEKMIGKPLISVA